MMRWVKYAVALVVLTTVFYFVQGYLYERKRQTSKTETGEQTVEAVDYRASFLIYTNGTQRNFFDPKYRNLSEEVYITSDNPNIIIIKKISTWGDFFDTLPMELTKDCLETGDGERFCTDQDGELKFYLNGKRFDDLLYEEIKDKDRVLVTFGQDSETEIQRQIFNVPNPHGAF